MIGRDTAKEIEVLTNQVKLMKSCLQIKLLTHQVGAAQNQMVNLVLALKNQVTQTMQLITNQVDMTNPIDWDTAKEIAVLTNQVKRMKSCLQIKMLTHQVGAAQTKKTVSTVAKTKARAMVGAMVGVVELKEVKTPGNDSCLFHDVQVTTKFNTKQLREMTAGTVVPNVDVEHNGVFIRQWIFDETAMTPEDYETVIRDNKWGGQIELWLLAQSLNTSIGVYVQPKKDVFTIQHIFQPVSRRNDVTEPIHVMYGKKHHDELV